MKATGIHITCVSTASDHRYFTMLVHDEVGLSICKFYLYACMFVYKSETRINLPLVF